MAPEKLSDSARPILMEVDTDGIALITVNRPDKLNTLNAEALDGLESCTEKIAAYPEIKGVIITGAGERSFVAGADIAEFLDLTVRRGDVEPGSADVPKLETQTAGGISEEGKSIARRGQEVFNLIEHLNKPVIAAINGFTLGGGCELAMACHIRIASEKAKFGQPEIKLGIIPGYGGTQRLSRLVGTGVAAEMILTGEIIGARRALDIGLVNRTVPPEKVLDAAYEMMRSILRQAPVAIGLALEAIRASAGPVKEGYAAEADLFGRACGTDDFKEGISAFLEKRKPDFRGR